MKAIAVLLAILLPVCALCEDAIYIHGGTRYLGKILGSSLTAAYISTNQDLLFPFPVIK